MSTAVFTFGRMNPPTIGHEKLVNKLRKVARLIRGQPFIYLSHSQDAKKNPLDYNSKIKNMNYKSAYKLIKTHKNIESISENTNYNIYYDYNNIRGIFKNCDIDESIIQNIKKSKETVFTSCDLIKLVKFLEEKSSITKKTFLFRLNKMYKKNRITTPNKYSCFDSTYKINTSCLTK
jgi:hypothetical protein